MSSPVADADVTAAVSRVNQDLLPRRINFVPAKFEYKMQINDSIVFATHNEHFSICFGSLNGAKSAKKNKPSIFDPKRLATIKNWEKRYNIGRGFDDSQGSKRGFATSVLFALKSCPSFRQFSKFHTSTCKRVGCTLCKIYRFFDDIEAQKNSVRFPLDLNVFDKKWTVGNPGDSAEFFNQLMNSLQNDEREKSRAYQSLGEFTTAIGQMFRIESVNKIVCSKCGKEISSKDGYWTLYSPGRVERAIDQTNKITIQDGVCEECGGQISCLEEFTELPFIFTIQLNTWDEKGQYKKRQFQYSKLENIKIGDTKYKLCALTAYDGKASDGGKFNAAFMSSSGTWSSYIDGKISPMDVNQLSIFQPQLLFFTRDEPNETIEEAGELVRISNSTKDKDDINISSESDSEDHSKRDLKSATDSLTQSILKQLQKHAPQTNESQIKNNSNDVIVVDTSDPKKRKTDFKNKKNIKLKQISNPLEKLLKSKNAHETATWD